MSNGELSKPEAYHLASARVNQGVMQAVSDHFEAHHITRDKLALEIRAVAQMAALDGQYKDAFSGYRLAGEVKQLINKDGSVPAPLGGVHQHQHVHMHEAEIDKASDEDLKAQLAKITALESNIKDAEYYDDVDLE